MPWSASSQLAFEAIRPRSRNTQSRLEGGAPRRRSQKALPGVVFCAYQLIKCTDQNGKSKYAPQVFRSNVNG